MTLKSILNDIADIIMAKGTTAARKDLTALAAAVRDTQPGAAAALTDWEGSEIARERAFAVIRHEVVRAGAERQLAIAMDLAAFRAVALAA